MIYTLQCLRCLWLNRSLSLSLPSTGLKEATHKTNGSLRVALQGDSKDYWAKFGAILVVYEK